ncbi:MAG: hypothetical protein JO099_09045 [Acidobacteriia bacterium]|nr:hypothetical protein [Terriglobia bacterium]
MEKNLYVDGQRGSCASPIQMNSYFPVAGMPTQSKNSIFGNEPIAEKRSAGRKAGSGREVLKKCNQSIDFVALCAEFLNLAFKCLPVHAGMRAFQIAAFQTAAFPTVAFTTASRRTLVGMVWA